MMMNLDVNEMYLIQALEVRQLVNLSEIEAFIPKKEIVKKGYDLSINRYKEIEYDEVEYEDPKVIIQRIKELEQQILDGLNDIERMV